MQHINALFKLCLAMMDLIHPQAKQTGDAIAVATGIAFAVDRGKLPAGWTERLTVAVLVQTAWEESRFRQSAVGDSGRSRGAFQIMGVPGVEHDAVVGAVVALGHLYVSAPTCINSPLAAYCGGCNNRGAKRLGDARWAKAELLDVMAPELEDDDSEHPTL